MRPHILRVLAALLVLQIPCALHAQVATSEYPLPSNIQIGDARLHAVLQRLLVGSPTARAVVQDLTESGLQVSIGTPAQAPALGAETRADGFAGGASSESLAWMAVRVAPAANGEHLVERVWIAIDVQEMADRIARVAPARADAMLEADLLVTLAHEFVAHVGSIARSRRPDDFCEDPTPASQSIDALGCSVRVENRVRRELNRGLGLRGPDRLPERLSYSLEVMNFARGGF